MPFSLIAYEAERSSAGTEFLHKVIIIFSIFSQRRFSLLRAADMFMKMCREMCGLAAKAASMSIVERSKLHLRI